MLQTVENPPRLVWVAIDVLMLGHVDELTLAPNGNDPGPPHGVAVHATDVIEPYVGFPAEILGVQLLAHGYATRTHWWDWRKTIYPAGQNLAARIRAEVSAEDPCAIVCHSAGGLVARAAWTELGLTGQQGLVRRIVTCGTPHWGSYAVLGFWSGDDDIIRLCLTMNQTLGYNTYGFAPQLTGYRYLEAIDLRRMAMTWPAMYECLPTLGAPDAEDDPHREFLYTATNWPAAVRPQQAWLTWSRDHTGPWLRSAASQPPSHVMTCLSGRGRLSVSALVDPQQLGTLAALGQPAEGDGAVTRVASELSQSAIVGYEIDHINWFATLANSGHLANHVLDIRAPSPVPPPPEVSDQPQTTNLGPLPLPGRPFNGAVSPCLQGLCPC